MSINMTTGTICISYRIDTQRAIGGPDEIWDTVREFIAGHQHAEREYDALRNSDPTGTYRLVMIHEHAERCGRGRVYE